MKCRKLDKTKRGDVEWDCGKFGIAIYKSKKTKR